MHSETKKITQKAALSNTAGDHVEVIIVHDRTITCTKHAQNDRHDMCYRDTHDTASNDNIIGHFRDESSQTINYTATANRR